MAYATLSDCRQWLGIVDSADDSELSAALAAAELAVNAHCGQSFSLAGSASARVFRPTNAVLLDLVAAGSPIGNTTNLAIAIDDNDDGTYETTLAAADYVLEPLNNLGPGAETWPTTAVRIIGRSWPSPGSGRARVQITARWGWPTVPARVKTATIMLTVAWHQRRMTMTGRSGFEGFFASVIRDDETIADLLSYYRDGTAIAGVA